MFKFKRKNTDQDMDKLLKKVFTERKKAIPEYDRNRKHIFYRTIPRNFRTINLLSQTRIKVKFAIAIVTVCFCLVIWRVLENDFRFLTDRFHPTKIVYLQDPKQDSDKFKPTVTVQITENDQHIFE